MPAQLTSIGSGALPRLLGAASRNSWLLLLLFSLGCDSEPTAVEATDEPSPEVPTVNLLVNGDAESGEDGPEGWSRGGPGLDLLALDWTSSTSRDGVRSLAIGGASPGPDAWGYWAQAVPLPESATAMHLLSAWIRVDELTGAGAAIAVRGDDTLLDNQFAEAFATTQELQIIDGTHDWRLISVGLTGIPSSVDRIRVFLIYLPETTGTVYFDGIDLTVVEETAGVAGGYMFSALNIMESWSINRYVIDWPAFRDQANSDATGAQVPAHAYGALRRAIHRLGDNHSSFRPPPLDRSPAPPLPTPPALPSPLAPSDPSAATLEGDIGYLEVTAFSGGGVEADQLATRYHRLIESVDAPGTCGWVVDLRGNTGGNMWPMIAGVGPILGDGIAGYFVDPDDNAQSWFYDGGRSGIDATPITTAADHYELSSPDPPVAVLTDGRTASSGEATAISFRERPDARSFGTPTWGVSTANRGFGLSDGALINLTVSTMADRTRRLYGLQVHPDEVVEGPKTGDPTTDAPLQRAIDWLHAQPQCTQ